MPQRVKDFVTFLTSKALRHYCGVCQEMVFKTVYGSGTIVSGSAQLHKESIPKAKAAASTQVSKFCFHRAILGIKLLHLLFIRKCHLVSEWYCNMCMILIQYHCSCLNNKVYSIMMHQKGSLYSTCRMLMEKVVICEAEMMGT
jgi:hypothetical protein